MLRPRACFEAPTDGVSDRARSGGQDAPQAQCTTRIGRHIGGLQPLTEGPTMKLNRDLATPLTIGTFAIMSVTGILMFFHADVGLNKLVHEWVGWVMVLAVALHAVVNWTAFKRYFVSSTSGRAIIVLGLVALAGSFWPAGGNARGGQPPHIMAMKAVASAPIATVAPLTGRPVQDVMAALAKAGLNLTGPDATIASVAQGDRGLEAKAMRALFAKP